MDKQTFARAFGDNLKALRKKQGLSQEKLAEAIEKTVDTISGIERGISYPRIETAIDIAEALKIPVYQLFILEPHEQADSMNHALLMGIYADIREEKREVLEIIHDQIRNILALKSRFSQP